MSIQKIAGRGFALPYPLCHSNAPAYNSSLLIDAATEKAAAIGRVFNKDGTTKNISKVGFRFGAITKAGSTDIQVSLQDVAAASPDPDGVVDQSALVGNANIVANTWTVVTLGATRTVAFGELISIVWEFSTFNASDSIVISQVTNVSGATLPDQTFNRLFTGTWASQNQYVNVILGFDDGTWGTLDMASSASALNTHNINTGSTPDEAMLAFQFPFPFSTDGCWVFMTTGGDVDVLLLDAAGNTITSGSRSIDKDHDDGGAVGRTFWIPWAAHITDRPANTDHFISVKPTSATNVTVYSFDVADAAYLDAHDGGQTFCWAQRTDGGSISKTTTRRPYFGIRVNGCEAGGGGAPLIGRDGGLIAA